MSPQVFDNFLAIMDDAIALAKEAVDSADVKGTPEPQVTLTKVASSTCDKAAKALKPTGLFPGMTLDEISRNLQDGGAGYHITLMEKLASSAVFPIMDNPVRDGELVEKSASSSSYQNLSPKTATWQKAFDEAEAEMG